MARQRVALAKISRPRLFGVVARERLFNELDQARRRPIVWVVGPPGAGKTTLVATYLESRRLRGIWYQVDGGDADPGSLFYYLAQAAAAATPRKRRALPLLRPEYLRDLSGFTRRFFRELYSGLPAGSVVVLDNYQEVALTSVFHGVVADAVAETRADVNLLVLSRADPPQQLARALANNEIAKLEWEALRLTFAETAAIVASTHDLDDQALHSMQEQSSGWAAGLILMLERLKRTGSVAHLDRSETMDTVFDYFAGQVFDQTPTATRQLLLRTAFLPSLTAAAAEDVSGNPDAGKLLEDLYRRHLFTDRRVGAEVTYQYHALFRRFLISRLEHDFGPRERILLQRRSAQLLEQAGHADDALQLHVGVADWSAASDLIVREARSLIAQGRWLTLKAWIARLPSEHVEATPWLTLWLGSALILVNPPEARRMLGKVFERFGATADPLGQLLAATGTAESFNIECSAFDGLDPWIEALSSALKTVGLFPSPAVRLRACTALMLATMLRQPAHPEMPECAERAFAMLDEDIGVTSKVDAATQLLQYYDYTGNLESAEAVVAKATAYFKSTELPPLRIAGWLVFLSYHSVVSGAYREGFDSLGRARAIAEECGLPWFKLFDSVFSSLLHIMRGDLSSAGPLVQRLASLVDPGRPSDSALHHLAETMLHQARGDAGQSVLHAAACLEASATTGGALYNILFPPVAACAFISAGQHDRAASAISLARTLSAGTPYSRYEALLLMVEAYSASVRGACPSGQHLLRQALTLARETNTVHLCRWMGPALARMLAEALDAGIEPAFARDVVRRFGVDAPPGAGEAWPWPIRIFALGRLKVVIGDEPLVFGRKVPKKPLEMLQYLVAHGGLDVDVAPLADALWPDADGAAAMDSVEVTLRRLRRLLRRDDALAFTAGRLSLDPRSCWVDAWALEAVQRRTAELLGGSEPPESVSARLEELTERAFRLHPGPLPPDPGEHGWILRCRQRSAAKFVRQATSVGQHWEEMRDLSKAAAVYPRALELEPLAEPLYQRLMAVHARLGNLAGALATYERCRQSLAGRLGASPSPETEAIRRRLVPA